MCSVGAGPGEEDDCSGPVMRLKDGNFPGSRFPQGRFWLDPSATLALHTGLGIPQTGAGTKVFVAFSLNEDADGVDFPLFSISLQSG